MKLFKFILIVLCSLLMTTVFAQSSLTGNWDVVVRHFDFGEIRTRLDFKQQGKNGFRALSHRQGVRNLVGGFKAGTSRVFSKKVMLRTGTLCQLESGVVTWSAGETKFTGQLKTPMSGDIQVEGTVSEGKLWAKLTNAKGRNVGILEGTPSTGTAPLDDYPTIVKKLLETYDERIYDKRVLNTPAFKTFAKKMKASARKAQDDMDLLAAFYTHSDKLPFTHTSFFRTEMPAAGNGQIKARFSHLSGQVSLEEKPNNTVVLRIKSFRCPARDMDSVMQIVLAKGYQHLIVDIRGNSGGSLEGGVTLSKYLVPEETPTGVYLTQKWFEEHPLPPTKSELETMPAFTKPDVLDFLNTLDEKGIVVLKVTPGPQRFTGKLFLLVDQKSASASEPLAWNMKNSGHATVVGEHTAGAMLSAKSYAVCSGFNVVIPNADYYTPTGERLDKIGVAPHIEVKSGEALEYVLKNLIKC